jgi:hypothetical protein
MKVLYFSRYVDDSVTSVRSGAEVIYVPSEHVAATRLTERFIKHPFQYNTDVKLLAECARIARNEKPYSSIASIRGIKEISAGDGEVRDLIAGLREQATLQERIDTSVINILTW